MNNQPHRREIAKLHSKTVTSYAWYSFMSIQENGDFLALQLTCNMRATSGELSNRVQSGIKLVQYPTVSVVVHRSQFQGIGGRCVRQDEELLASPQRALIGPFHRTSSFCLQHLSPRVVIHGTLPSLEFDTCRQDSDQSSRPKSSSCKCNLGE